MTRTSIGASIVLIVLAALLALPVGQMVSPVEAKQRTRTVTETYANPALIYLPIAETFDSSAFLYPSPIVVSGLRQGKIRDVNVRLNNLNHPYPGEVRVLLVGPGGQTAIVMAHAGANGEVLDVTLRLDDEAEQPLPNVLNAALDSGTYRPTNTLGTPIDFNEPAPPVTSGNAALSVFDGTNPNGTWRLFVQDDFGPARHGAFMGGWTLELEVQVREEKRKKR